MEKKEKLIDEIRAAIKKKKVVIGTDRTLKNLKLGKVVKIFLSKNCPDNILDDVKYYSKLSKIEVVKLAYANDELGVVCKKPFPISVLSISK